MLSHVLHAPLNLTHLRIQTFHSTAAIQLYNLQFFPQHEHHSTLQADSDQAKAAILTALGIEGTVDEFLAMDIWALAEAENDNGLRLQRLNQQIALVMTTIQTLDEDRLAAELPSLAEDAAAAIATQISSTGTINLESTSQLIEIINRSLPDLDDGSFYT